jgi:serine/threonine-protein kinase
MIGLGQTIGNYRITAKLGEGGMGVVFRAEHPVIARRVALKAIHPEFGVTPAVISRFINEATLLSQIGHEHIVDVTDFGRTDDGDFYFIMEYLQGEALSAAIERGPLAPARALAIAAQVADALAASHARGVVHRDLKPENVFLTARGGTRDFVKVLDFGLAELVSGQAPERGDHGGGGSAGSASSIMGTPYYMAPELCEGKDEIDARADVYALGVVLFEMLTGKVPFGGDSASEILVKQIFTRPPAARGIVADLPAALDVILHRALAKAPADRFPSMEAFRAALLDPEGHAGGAPRAILDDVTERVRTARPMARGELGPGDPGRAPTRSTLREAVGAFATDPGEAPRPARARWLVAGAGAALALVALQALRAPAPATAPQRAAEPAVTVRLNFGSDPAGAEIFGADGRRLGLTPLSTVVMSSDGPARYVLRKAGYLPKAVSLIPNVSSPVFVALEPEPGNDPPLARRARVLAPARPATTRRAPTIAARATTADDDVLAPSLR